MASLYTVKSAFLMIIIDNDSKGVSANTPQDSQGSPSDAAPPSFDESVDHVMLDFSQRNAPGGEDSPPEFTPYEADYFKAKNGCIISHDPHLNEDGLYLGMFHSAITYFVTQVRPCIASYSPRQCHPLRITSIVGVHMMRAAHELSPIQTSMAEFDSAQNRIPRQLPTLIL